MFLEFLIGLVVLVIFLVYWKFIRPEKQVYDALRAQGIPGEPFIPIIGQLPEIRRHRQNDTLMSYLDTLFEKHGNMLLFNFGPISRLMTIEPDMIADVLSRQNASNYIKPPLFSTVFTPLVGHHSLLVSEGSEHERARKMINPAFHHTSLKSMVSIIARRTSQAIDDLLLQCQSEQFQKDGIDLQTEFNAWTLSIIASSAFGSGFETIKEAKELICRLFNEVLDAISYRSMHMINQVPFLARLPFFKKNVVDEGARAISDLVDRIIADRRQGLSSSLSDGPDLLDLLLSAVDDNGKPFNDQEVKEESLTFVLAGSETTANLMVWLMYLLMTHQEAFRACREEVDRVLPNNEEPNSDKLTELSICEAVINEALRLYPPASLFVRQCIKEHYVGTERRIRVPVGATIIVNSFSLHRRADLWPRPLEFDYTRWLRDPKTNLKPKLIHPYAYLPFAAGPRNCIGQNFALLEGKIILAMLMQRCDFELIPGQKITPDLKITMRAKYGLRVRVHPRRS